MSNSNILKNYKTIIKDKAYLTVFSLWSLAFLFLCLKGQFQFALMGLGITVLVIILSLITIKITKPTNVESHQEQVNKKVLWMQVFFLLLIILITTTSGLSYHRQLNISIPIWQEVIQFFGNMGNQFLPNNIFSSPFNSVANPVQYFLIPFVFLFPFTRLKYLGFNKGQDTLKVIFIWCLIPILLTTYSLLSGVISIPSYGLLVLSHVMQNGPFEEFLFRGALQSRLEVLLGQNWGLVITALLFGIWHIGLGYAQTGTDNHFVALSSVVLSQMVLGLAFGIIFQRTKNLIACSTVHVLINATVI